MDSSSFPYNLHMQKLLTMSACAGLGWTLSKFDQAELCQNFLLLVRFLLVKGPVSFLIQSLVLQNRCYGSMLGIMSQEDVLTLYQTTNFKMTKWMQIKNRNSFWDG